MLAASLVHRLCTHVVNSALRQLPGEQVYKGRLRGSGRAVAVKVQRPDVRESIALDVHILRIVAGWFARWRKLNSDLPSLLDEAHTRDLSRAVWGCWCYVHVMYQPVRRCQLKEHSPSLLDRAHATCSSGGMSNAAW